MFCSPTSYMTKTLPLTNFSYQLSIYQTFSKQSSDQKAVQINLLISRVCVSFRMTSRRVA
ncbi:hypothetical protein Plhal304r1_c049g0131831 [Plasmopara halstedii]